MTREEEIATPQKADMPDEIWVVPVPIGAHLDVDAYTIPVDNSSKYIRADLANKPALDAVDAAYKERNQVVAALAKCFPSGIAKTAIDGWDEAWHNCVYIDLPTGQASWHYHDRDVYLFESLPPYTKKWDGHSTPEKYERLHSLSAAPDAEVGIGSAYKLLREIRRRDDADAVHIILSSLRAASAVQDKK